MPIIGSFGAGAAGGYGQRKGSKGPPLMDYLVVAGGGGGQQGGAGAGGYRTSFPGGTQMELEAGTPYPVTVGAGSNPGTQRASNSIAVGGTFTIDSTGGGRGGPAGAFPTSPPNYTKMGWPGGSGGGAATGNPQAGGGGGNAGGYDPPEGKGGGQNYPLQPGGAGGGGASQGGSPSPALTPTGGKGGDGAANSISGSSVGYAGGGAGQPGTPGQYGGPTFTGGGGDGATGGTGKVILRGPGDYSYTVAPGSNTTSAQPDGTVVITMNVTGTVQAD